MAFGCQLSCADRWNGIKKPFYAEVHRAVSGNQRRRGRRRALAPTGWFPAYLSGERCPYPDRTRAAYLWAVPALEQGDMARAVMGKA